MDQGFLPLPARCGLYAQALAVGAAANRSRTAAMGGERSLFEACGAFARLEQRKIRMLETGCEDDLRLELALARLGMEQADHLSRMCDGRAQTLLGHRARAISFAAWDAGDLAYRARECQAVEDMILHAIVRDLTTGREGR